MRKEYDLTKLKSRRNPYAKHLKQQVTIRLGVDVIDYFKELAEETGIPYQNLVNLYLRDCASSKLRPRLDWVAEPGPEAGEYVAEQGNADEREPPSSIDEEAR